MGSINFIGSTNDGGDDKESQRYDFDYTDPEKDTSNTGRVKPKTSFFGRHKKAASTAPAEQKKAPEATFVDKQQVRKGKYKPTGTKYQPQKAGSNTAANQAAVYAPTRPTTQSSVQPTFAQVNHTEPITPAPAAPQSIPAPARQANTRIQPNLQPAIQSVQPAPHVPTPPPGPTIQPATTSTPLPSTPGQPQVFPATSNTAPNSTSVSTSRVLSGGLQSQSIPTPTHTTAPLTNRPVLQKPDTIPTPPPPPVHAAPLPTPVRTTMPSQQVSATSAVARPSAMPTMQNMQQSGYQKMYDTAAQARQDTIMQQPVLTPAVAPQPQIPVLQTPENPNLPHLTTAAPAIKAAPSGIPVAPLPPVHDRPAPLPTPTSAPAPAPVARPAVQQPTGQPAMTSQTPPTPLGQPAVAHSVSTQSSRPGVVHAQYVESMHGEKTNPEPIGGKFLAVNLLPVDFLKELTPASKVVRLIKVAVLSCTVVGVIYGIMVGYQSYYIIQTKNNQLEINRLEQEILTYAPLQNDINTTNAQLQSVSTLLARHIYWSNVFAILEDYTLPNVYYQNFSGNTSGLITLQAMTTDFASVSRQIHILNEEAPFILSASSNTATRSDVADEQTDTTEAAAEVSETDTSTTPGEVISFTINMHLDPAIFLYQSNANHNGNN